jgi:thiol-disulfide isomerase/thioredoxin
MPSKKKGAAPPILDVSADEHLPALDELIKNNTIVFVNVYADWCGHCHTYKPMLEEFAKIPGRKLPMARINEKVLAKTAAANAKLKGFPSNILMGRDGSFAEFKDEEGEATHAVPNMRDKKAMRTLLVSDPSKLTKNTYSNDDTPEPTMAAEKLLKESGKKAYKNRNAPVENMERPTPPNMNADTVEAPPYTHTPLAKNGSLFQTLQKLLKEDDEAPPAVGKKTRVNRHNRRRTTAKARRS